MSDYYQSTEKQIAALPLFAASRATDPATSRAAAATAPVRGHCRLVLDAFGQGPAGQTEIARRCGLLPHQVNKRIADLAAAGMLELTGRLVEQGREREWQINPGVALAADWRRHRDRHDTASTRRGGVKS